ncbi:hypothetical protein U1Q18_011068 [Sarracenia purpurea var. burkii]
MPLQSVTAKVGGSLQVGWVKTPLLGSLNFWLVMQAPLVEVVDPVGNHRIYRNAIQSPLQNGGYVSHGLHLKRVSHIREPIREPILLHHKRLLTSIDFYASRQIRLEGTEVWRNRGLATVGADAVAVTVSVSVYGGIFTERHAAAEGFAAEVRHQGEYVAAEGSEPILRQGEDKRAFSQVDGVDYAFVGGTVR